MGRGTATRSELRGAVSNIGSIRQPAAATSFVFRPAPGNDSSFRHWQFIRGYEIASGAPRETETGRTDVRADYATN